MNMNDITMKQSIFFQRVNQLRIYIGYFKDRGKTYFFKASPLLSGRVRLKMGIFGNLLFLLHTIETSLHAQFMDKCSFFAVQTRLHVFLLIFSTRKISFVRV